MDEYNQMLAQALGGGNFESFSTQNQVMQAPMQLPNGYVGIPGQMPVGSYRGEIAFRVVRSSSNINAVLPYPIGCGFLSGFNSADVVRQTMPSGVKLDSVSVNVAENKTVYTFSSLANPLLIDTVSIFGDSYNLFSFNNGLISRKGLTNVIRITTPDVQAITNAVSSSPVRPFTSTWLSNLNIDRNTVSLSPGQFNKNVFDINSKVEISDEKGIVFYTFPDVANAATAHTYVAQFFFETIVKI